MCGGLASCCDNSLRVNEWEEGLGYRVLVHNLLLFSYFIQHSV